MLEPINNNEPIQTNDDALTPELLDAQLSAMLTRGHKLFASYTDYVTHYQSQNLPHLSRKRWQAIMLFTTAFHARLNRRLALVTLAYSQGKQINFQK